MIPIFFVFAMRMRLVLKKQVFRNMLNAKRVIMLSVCVAYRKSAILPLTGYHDRFKKIIFCYLTALLVMTKAQGQIFN